MYFKGIQIDLAPGKAVKKTVLQGLHNSVRLISKLMPGKKLRMIVYVSHCRIPERDVEPTFYEIAAQSFVHNESAGVSGVLIYDKHCFFELIEGPDMAVGRLFERIQADTRHERIRVLVDKEIGKKSFGNANIHAYFLDDTSISFDPTYLRMKDEFKNVCLEEVVPGQAFVGFTKSLMSAFDQYRIMN